jgi:hypothetical protein
MKRLLVVAALIGCSAESPETTAKPSGSDTGVVVDSATDAPVATCDESKPFGPLKKLSVNTTVWEQGGRLSSDELTLYFARLDEDGYDIFSAKRASRDAPFGEATTVAALNYPKNHNQDAMLSPDGLKIFFSRGFGNMTLLMAKRATINDAFGVPAGIGLDSDVAEVEPYLSFDGSELWFARQQPYGGALQLHVAKAMGDAFDVPRRVDELTPKDMTTRSPVLTRDGLTLYFAMSTLTTALNDVYVAHRTSLDGHFGDPRVVPELTSAAEDYPTWISPDGCRIYLTSDRDGGNRGDLYVAER